MAAILAVVFTCGVCGFFLYVLVQFRRDEKHPRRGGESLAGFPMVASGQIVRPFLVPKKQSNGKTKAAPRKDESDARKKRGVS